MYRIDEHSIRNECNYYIFYDPKNKDAVHFEYLKDLIPPDRLFSTCIPYGGHCISIYLNEINLLKRVTLESFNNIWFKARELLKYRRKSSIYLSNIYKELVYRKKSRLAFKLLNILNKELPENNNLMNRDLENMEILQRKRLKVIIPFYKNSHLVDSLFESLVSCASEFNSLGAELILINDSPDDPQLSAELEKWLKSNTRLNLRLITNSKNLGFLKSINQGLKIVIEAKDDVLLLNSDTYIFPEALRELSEVAYSDPMIGFVSPRSNNATLCTLPSNGGLKDSPIEYYKDFLLLKNYFHRTSYVPTVVGFCMFIKSEILLNFGVLDPIYGYGYSEENDLIMRANKCGYKAALANHAFVWHKGSASFGLDEGSVIKAENEVLLNKRYPEYEPLIFRYFDSPEFRAEKLVAGLMPDRQGKFIIGFDCRNIGTYFNGTALAARELIFSAAKYWPNNIRIKVMMSLEAWNFHKFSENTRIEWLNPLDASAPMGAVVRIGQPFLTGDIDRLLSLAPVVSCFMLDTISDDCGELSLKFDVNLWRFVMKSFDIIFTNSNFTAQQFRRRYEIGLDTLIYPTLHSTNPSDYVSENSSSDQRTYTHDILVIGNKFLHKGVESCVNLLINTFGDLQIVVMAHSEKKIKNVNYLSVGNLSTSEINSLYINSKIAIFPTYYEGFGFPLMNCLASRTPIFLRPLPPFIEIVSKIVKGKDNIYWYTDNQDLSNQLSKGIPIWRGDTAEGEVLGWKRSAEEVLEQLLIATQNVKINKLASRMRWFELSFRPILPRHNLNVTNVAIQFLIPILSKIFNRLFQYSIFLKIGKTIRKLFSYF